ncbi:MAG: M20 family peptidase [Chloroflexota bacterium]|nr:MAG: M20 family peptidase [Chloroflexota bacterium]
MGALVESELGRLGARVTIEPQEGYGNNVIGQWGRGDEKGGILTLCHMDTVHPTGVLERFPCHRQAGMLYGPGSMDMKAGIAILLAALQMFHEKGQALHRPLTALFTSDEETGSEGSRGLIESLASKASLVLCLEPARPDGALKTSRKGVGSFNVVVRGRAAHAGAAHEKGINAIEEMAHQVIQIQKMTDYEKGTTLNVGAIQGGTVSNVVPGEARIEVDFRVMRSEEAGRIVEQMHSLMPGLEGAALEVTGGLNRPPMPRDERMAATFEKARLIAAKLGLDLTEGGVGSASDANFVAPLGVPVLDGLGAQGDGMHTEGEYVLIDSLPRRAALLAALLSEW